MSKAKKVGYWDNYKCNHPARCDEPSPCDDDLPPFTSETKAEEMNRKAMERYHRENSMTFISNQEGDIPLAVNGDRQFSHGEITLDLAALKGEILAGRRLSKVAFNRRTANVKYMSGFCDENVNTDVVKQMSVFYYLKMKYGYIGNSKKGLHTFLEGMMAAYSMVNFL
jgi:hypothetical protein